jgi:hypothetical protein
MSRDSLANLKMFTSDEDSDPSSHPVESDVPLNDPPYDPRYVIVIAFRHVVLYPLFVKFVVYLVYFWFLFIFWFFYQCVPLYSGTALHIYIYIAILWKLVGTGTVRTE